MKTTEDLFKASEEIGQGDKSEIQGGREMRITEAQESISLMRGYVNQVLDYLQEQNFQKAVEDGLYIELHLLSNYDEAIDFLIERGRTDLLEQCNEIYKTAYKAEPLITQALDKYEEIGKRIGDTGCLSSCWALHIVFFWEEAVCPILQTNSQVQAEATPQKQGNKPQQVPSWATTNEAKRAFAKAVELDYMSPLDYGYKWKIDKGLLAYFVECLSNASIQNSYPDTGACAYFHTKNLRQLRDYYLNTIGGKPKNFDKIDALFE